MLNIIVAPGTYNKTGEKYAKKVVRHLKNEQIEYAVYFSQDFDNLKENMMQITQAGENEFVVIGDDCVISAVISCFKDLNKIKLGIVPTSKHDDFAKYLKINSNPIQAVKDILMKNIANVDLLIVNDMTVLNSIIVGASVEVAHMHNQFKIKNALTEKYALAKYGINFSGIDLIFDNKSKAKKENVFELIVANGGLSKGKPVSPLSNLQDGLFNVNYRIASNSSNKKKFIKMLNKGEHIYDEETKQYWMKSLKVTNPDKKIKALIDGKIYNLEELNISILENALKIYKRP